MKKALVPLLLLLAGAGVAGQRWLESTSRAEPGPLVYEARRGPLTISVVESGTIESRENVKVYSQVPGKHTILYLIEEGIRVEPGDLLVQLDSSTFETQRREQEAQVEAARSDHLRELENLEVERLDSENEISKAALELKLARLDAKRFEEEDFPRDMQRAETRITLAREDLQRATEKLDWSSKLADQGYLTRTELQADELAEKRARLELELAERELRTLSGYSRERTHEELRARMEQAERSLERATRRSNLRLQRAEGQVRWRKSELDKHLARLEDIRGHLANTRITAPVEGLVVYATTGRRRYEPLAEGQAVRQRQHLISLPTSDAMVASVKVHESSLQKIAVGMSAIITTDALPGQSLEGRVTKIAPLPDPQMAWLNASLKVYTTRIEILDAADGLRPGMNCQAEIVVERHDDAIFVPLQSVVRAGDSTLVYLPGDERGPRPLPVTIGLDNNRVVHVTSGLEPGQAVLVAPPLDAGNRDASGGAGRP